MHAFILWYKIYSQNESGTTLISLITMLPLVVASRNAGRASSTLAVRHYSRSAIVKAEPTLHNATGKWDELKSKRPIQEDEQHVSFFVIEIPNSIIVNAVTGMIDANEYTFIVLHAYLLNSACFIPHFTPRLFGY